MASVSRLRNVGRLTPPARVSHRIGVAAAFDPESLPVLGTDSHLPAIPESDDRRCGDPCPLR